MSFCFRYLSLLHLLFCSLFCSRSVFVSRLFSSVSLCMIISEMLCYLHCPFQVSSYWMHVPSRLILYSLMYTGLSRFVNRLDSTRILLSVGMLRNIFLRHNFLHTVPAFTYPMPHVRCTMDHTSIGESSANSVQLLGN